MARIGVLYATTEGHTAKVARHVADRIAQAGHAAGVHAVAELEDDFDPSGYDAVVLAASIHEGRYQHAFVRFLREQREALAARPTLLLTVCLAIKSPFAEERAEAERFPGKLHEQTGFTATAGLVVAGALAYTRYSWLKRMLMRYIAEKEGGDTDTSRDHEYTDWPALDARVDAFLAEHVAR